MRISRSTGALSGLLILILGLWGALIPFIGPYFHYSFGSNAAWHYSTERLWLDIIPGAAAVLSGLLLMSARTRVSGVFASWLGIASGIWFVVGVPVSLLWHPAGYPIGAPVGGQFVRMLEWVGYFYLLGALIVAFAAFALGRFVSRPALIDDGAAADAEYGAAAPTDAEYVANDRGAPQSEEADREEADREEADRRPVSSPTSGGPAEDTGNRTTHRRGLLPFGRRSSETSSEREPSRR